MQGVPQLPPEMRQALQDRRASCAASSTALPLSRSMPVVTWGVGEPDAAFEADRVIRVN
jgi:hypothetical protein